ncbi:MAG: HD domain-containing protein [bacterium]
MDKTTLRKILLFSKKERTEMFLVGGIIRDIFLGIKSMDYDVVMSKDAKRLAKKFAKDIKGAFVELDDQNKIYRVVKKTKKGIINIDFSQMRGNKIEDDLALRDFTIDAMALNLKHSLKKDSSSDIIDPFGGVKDIKKGIIRLVGPKIFKDDPLRLLRAFRLAAVLGFSIDSKTKTLAKKQAALIKKISGERIHEELIKTLGTKCAGEHIVEIDKSGILTALVPEIEPIRKAFRYYYHRKGLWGHSIDSLMSFEEISGNISRLFPKVKKELSVYLDEYLVNGVKRSAILKFAALFHDFGKPPTLSRKKGKVRFFGHEEKGVKIVKDIMVRLRFSNREIRTLEKVIRHHMRPGTLSRNKVITDKAIWKFFRDMEEDGVGVLLMSLADYYAYRKQDSSQKDIERHRKAVRTILYRYFMHREIISPALLLNGSDLMKNFGLSQGPMIGKLLHMLEEAQAEGRVKTRKQAEGLIKDILDNTEPL